MRTHTLLASSAAVLALTLTGCSAEDKDEPAAEPTPTQTVPAEAASHIVVDVTDDDVSTRDRIPTDENSIITTPSGTVEVESIESTPAVPSTLVDAAGASGGSGEMAVPAEGETFLVVTLSDTDADKSGEGAVVGFEMDGAPVQSPELRDSGTTTLLISAPEYGQAFLTVTEQEKTQKVNLADGVRDEETAAAGYYLDEPTPPGTIKLDPVKATGTIGLNGEAEKAATMRPTLTVDDLEFTAWTKARGWADEGEAWLLLNGSADMATSGAGELRGQATLDVDVLADGGEAGTFTVKLDESGGAREPKKQFSETVAVPVEAKEMAMKTSGTVAVSAAGGVELTSEESANAGSDEQEIVVGG